MFFSIGTVLIVLRQTFRDDPRSTELEMEMTTCGEGGLGKIGRIVEKIWPQRALRGPISRVFIYVTWIMGGGAVVLWFGAAVSGGDAEWVLPAVGLSLGTFLLFLATAFPARFTFPQRLTVGVAVAACLIIVGLVVFAAAMAGFSVAR
ncbi:hypothetical protein [Aporhodopirellula aestuarii]|uniref:Transmembrane protein n=1 Tax=Aporhodopirellula aestuarii TaxID=2950107 RepID=A0ABT0U5F2_9BACT|nr:hypothetical protein [Aporhodopirellula aestuarii]MCM2371889.1 hypothetical protein [Aporhodopirellula aestuarii]